MTDDTVADMTMMMNMMMMVVILFSNNIVTQEIHTNSNKMDTHRF